MNTDIVNSCVRIECPNEYKIEKNGVLTFEAVVYSEREVVLKLTVDGVRGVCLNCEGKNYLGESFEKATTIAANGHKRFWISVFGSGNCSLKAIGRGGEIFAEKKIRITQSDKETNDPFLNAESMNRLVWLNSDKAIDRSVVKPYRKVELNEDEISIIGRKIVLKNGFPSKIKSAFDKSVKITENFTDVISSEISFNVGKEKFEYKAPEYVVYDDSVIAKNEGKSDNFRIFTTAKVEFDGFIEIKNTLECLKDVETDDISLEIPMGEKAEYFVGAGKKSGYFDGMLDWKWDENKNQDCFWAGDVDGGLKVKFKGANYRKPFVNIYYAQRKLLKPESWDNGGKGGVRFENGKFVAYSGARRVKRGEKLVFDIEIIVTPLKEINLKKQVGMRFFHRMFGAESWLKEAKKGGANIVNVHHGNDLNPYINYPFVEIDALKKFADEAHESGISVKPYYTVRELSVYSPEFKAFMDFDGEIIAERDKNVSINPWQKESAAWVEENISKDVICAWRQPLKGKKYKDKYDASVITEGLSRLSNFYVEGLDYLVKKADIDGIYIDDTAYDRNTMKRARKVLDQKDGALVDFHQWNHHLIADGNCATMYMELYPYIDRFWIGEGFDYDESPDYWLTEISGIPYGVMSEMMDSGNQYRGLLFGMTSRLGWETNEKSPTNVWELFDRFDIANTEMKGWWDDTNPVSSDCAFVPVTAYIAKDKIYVSAANFSNEKEKAKLSVNGKSDLRFYAPYIRDFQSEGQYFGEIELDGGKGLFLVLDKTTEV